jgi:CRISPR-associated protein Csm5
MHDVATRLEGDRPFRRLGEAAEVMTLGGASGDPMRLLMAGDSDPAPNHAFKVYLVRAASLQERGGRPDLSWKPVSTFAEMAVPGTTFRGHWRVREHLRNRDKSAPERIFRAANEHAAELLSMQRRYAEAAGLPRLRSSLDALTSRLEEIRQRPGLCLLNIGWAGGFLGKAGFLDTGNDDYRGILRRMPLYERAIRTGIPFPKTRRIVWEGGQPSTLPGWVLFEVV